MLRTSANAPPDVLPDVSATFLSLTYAENVYCPAESGALNDIVPADESFAEYEPRSFYSIDCVKPVTPVVVSKLELSSKFSFPPPATDDAVLLPPSFSGKEYIVTS